VVPGEAIRWVLEMIGPGSRVTASRRLRVGGWHVNHALDVLDGGGGTHRLVLRRWARPGWEVDDPDYTVEREVAVLELLASSPVPAPVVVAADPAGARCDVPAILLTRLPGHPPRPAEVGGARFCSDLAEALAQVHAVEATTARRLEPYRLYYDRTHAAPAAWMPATPVWAQAIAAVREPPPTTSSSTSMTLIHRDYHPLNTLWSRGRLTAVVDWTQASSGPPGLDLGHMRWNLLADHGPHLADRFLDCYRATTGHACADQPYWDLVSLLDLLLIGHDPGDIEPDDLQRFEEYAKTALAART
jgi:aminoglycoside phosphotransferase (APT) family kinase protein